MQIICNSKRKLYFITNTSSEKMAHIKANPAVSVYYCNIQDFLGLMLGSKIKIVEVQEIKKALWHEGGEMRNQNLAEFVIIIDD